MPHHNQAFAAFSLTFINDLAGPRFKMKSLKDILAVVIGLLAAAFAIYYFYKFVTFTDPQGGQNYGWMALGLAAIAFVCGLIYFLGHVNKEEEIHITQ